MADRWYGVGYAAAHTAGVDWNSGTLKIALLTSSYTFSGLHDFFDDLTNEVTGTGYTAGGAALGSVTVVATVANSWGTTWATGTAFAAGKVVRPTSGNGFLYRSSGGTSHASTEPTWPTTIGATVVDNSSITWTCVGTVIVVFDAADPSWSTATITARYGVVYNSTGTAGTSALIALKDFGSNITSTAGTFSVTLDAQGFAYLVLE